LLDRHVADQAGAIEAAAERRRKHKAAGSLIAIPQPCSLEELFGPFDQRECAPLS
jgi:hypothetical protein